MPSWERAVQITNKLSQLSRKAADLQNEINQLLEYNSDHAIDWAAAELPTYLREDIGGTLQGFPFTRQNVANAIGSLDWIRKLLTSQSMEGSQGDHLGNLNQLAHP